MEFIAGFPSHNSLGLGPFQGRLGAKMALFPHKMPEKTLKITSKRAQNGVKTRFSASPTFKTYFWTKSLEVDFFTQIAPFSTLTAEAGPGLKKGLPEAKNRPFYR